MPPGTVVVDKATDADRDAYSGFQGTGLAERLRALGVTCVVVGGLATDYCVLETVLDALAAGFRVVVLEDAVRAVNVSPGDGERAIERSRGVRCRALDRGGGRSRDRRRRVLDGEGDAERGE